jgi:hypothetical protein
MMDDANTEGTAGSAADPEAPRPHPEDPRGENPFLRHSVAHKVWDEATNTALAEMFRFKEKMARLVSNPAELSRWTTEFVVGKFHIWAKRDLSIVQNRVLLDAYEQGIEGYRHTFIHSIRKQVPAAEPELRIQLLRACNHWKATAHEQVRQYSQLKAIRAARNPIETPAASGGVPKKTNDGIGTADLTVRKGDVRLLKKADGNFYESVDFPTAERYADITPRRRQQLLKGDGFLQVIGKGQNRRISVASLIAYCPPSENAK